MGQFSPSLRARADQSSHVCLPERLKDLLITAGRGLYHPRAHFGWKSLNIRLTIRFRKAKTLRRRKETFCKVRKGCARHPPQNVIISFSSPSFTLVSRFSNFRQYSFFPVQLQLHIIHVGAVDSNANWGIKLLVQKCNERSKSEMSNATE